ncbi:MAG: class II fructose-bisphosphate aldolase [Armatimonadetes bacterium]|nr:class II fructose-bisphosphate aldolase [Armatimonadota bacterium]
MPLITERSQVLDVYSDAADRGWVVPTFCSENLTTTEAVLSASAELGDRVGVADIPVTIAITNLYSHRSQTVNYTHTRQWDIGLKLFLADIEVLTSPGSPFSGLRVMVHLDHIQHDLDKGLLSWEMSRFSSIMFDASAVPFEQNIEATAGFVERHGKDIVVEGACDEIVDATGNEVSHLTSPERALEYVTRTGADFIVANLGTEHRASAADLQYHGDLARKIKAKIGPRIVLHGCSSVSNEQVRNLFDDGVAKVNIWTSMERDSSPALLTDMVRNAAKVGGPDTAKRLADEGYLGRRADLTSKAHLDYFTTVYRQGIVFDEMKRIVNSYLEMWYV